MKIFKVGETDVLSKPVDAVTDFRGIDDLCGSMISLMHRSRGVGLAAPQVGINKRVIVADVDEPISIVNPTIVWHGTDVEIAEEGCLSLPGQYVSVQRYTDIRVVGYTVHGKLVTFRTDSKLLARVLQHEIDHLSGITILDRAVALDNSI